MEEKCVSNHFIIVDRQTCTNDPHNDNVVQQRRRVTPQLPIYVKNLSSDTHVNLFHIKIIFDYKAHFDSWLNVYKYNNKRIISNQQPRHQV